MTVPGTTVPPLETRGVCEKLTCVSADVRERGVAFAFVGRTGGVSRGAYDSLNVDDRCADVPEAVHENRRRALKAIDAAPSCSLVVPHQVHGSHIVSITADGDGSDEYEDSELEGDAVVCTRQGVAVLMAFADCVPLVLVASNGFAVVHAGWRGALSRIAGSAACELARAAHCETSELWAYIGPHIGPASYEVSAELLTKFTSEFDPSVRVRESHLDLGRAVTASLEEVGVDRQAILHCGIDTATSIDRWFSYRKSGGTCGRHSALARLITRDDGGAEMGVCRHD